jgi:uncharacterized protein (DUF4415 family)
MKRGGGLLEKSMKSASQASTRSAATLSASSRRDDHGQKKKDNIVRYSLDEILRMPSQSDFARLKATTEEDIERQIAEDPDLQGFDDIDWSKAVFVDAPAKQPISIRLDADILDFFKSKGSGYQSRINRVLRHYMDSMRKPAE